MIIDLEQKDIKKMCDGRELTWKLPLGGIRIHSFVYRDSRLTFLLDYPSAENVLCEVVDCSFVGNMLTARLNVPDCKITRAFLTIFTGIFSGKFNGVILKFPELKVDLSTLDLPVMPNTVEMLPNTIRLTADYPPDERKSFELQKFPRQFKVTMQVSGIFLRYRVV